MYPMTGLAFILLWFIATKWDQHKKKREEREISKPIEVGWDDDDMPF